MTTPEEVGLLRLLALGLVVPEEQATGTDVTGTDATGTDATGAVRRLLAVQAQDLPGALTSVALRTASRDRAGVVAALDAGTVVRSWPMRGTLHLVAAVDLPWLLALGGPRGVARAAARHHELGLDARTLDAACEVALTVLADGAALTRSELLAAWERAGIGTEGQRGYHLIVHLAQTGRICQGPTVPDRPGEQLFVASTSWLPPTEPLDREDALAELALRYLTSHGPATAADLARWSSLPLTEVRRGIAAVRDRLAAVEVDGVELLMDPAMPGRLAACGEAARQVLLLPGFDEYLLGYASRDAVLAPEHAERIVPGRNGVFRPTVVVGGQVVATWRHVPGRRGGPATVAVEHFAEPAAVDERTVQEAYARLP